MTVETHFVQGGDGPVLTGSGMATLGCTCGHTLIEGYEPARFLAIGLQCGGCGMVTVTPRLADGVLPPRSAIVAAPSQEPRFATMTVPEDTAVVGQTEMRRLQALFQPLNPDSSYHVSAALLDAAEAAFIRYTGEALPDQGAGSGETFAGMRDHALGWAVRYLWARLKAGSWDGMQDAVTANAVTHVAGFLHFIATWSHHPLFPVMASTANDRGFSLHGLAPFAAAHCLTMLGNRIRFPETLGYPRRIDGFALMTGQEPVDVCVEVLDRFEFPFGRPWDHVGLRGAVLDLLGAAQSRINLRNPGVLVLSPGAALAGFDEALIEAVKAGVQALGRKNRGLMGVAPIVLRLQALPDPRSVRFGYGFFPILNRHYRGPGLLQTGG